MKLQTIKNISKKGFTLIELLVVITIIGILATGATSTYTAQIQKARDTTRINDIKALQSAVEQVYQDAMEYPLAQQDDADDGTNGFNAVSDYLDKYPKDSKHNKPCNIGGGTADTDSRRLGYVYFVSEDGNGITNGNFELSTGFEAKGNITGKAMTDSLGGSLYDNNRLEVGTSSKLKADGSVKGMDTSTTDAGTSSPTLNDTDGCVIADGSNGTTEGCN